MEKIDKNDKIKSLKYGTFHIVDEIEVIDGVTVVYTKDSKCFPLYEITKFNPFKEFINYHEKKSKGKESNLDEKTEKFYDSALTISVEVTPEEYFKLGNTETQNETKKSDFPSNTFPVALTCVFVFSFLYVFGNLFYEIYSIIK
jgi:hypothetical protein